jgi:hypothetical protein
MAADIRRFQRAKSPRRVTIGFSHEEVLYALDEFRRYSICQRVEEAMKEPVDSKRYIGLNDIADHIKRDPSFMRKFVNRLGIHTEKMRDANRQGQWVRVIQVIDLRKILDAVDSSDKLYQKDEVARMIDGIRCGNKRAE